MLIGWIITIFYCVAVLTPAGQYVVLAMLYVTAAFGASNPLLMFVPFPVLAGMSVVVAFKGAPTGRKYSYALQALAMWVLATIATAFAYGALDRAWSYGRSEPAVATPPPLRVPTDSTGR